jgi:hypothetical protein
VVLLFECIHRVNFIVDVDPVLAHGHVIFFDLNVFFLHLARQAYDGSVFFLFYVQPEFGVRQNF